MSQQTRERGVVAHARLAMVMGGTFVFIAAATILLLASGRGRWDLDATVFAMGLVSGLLNVAGWAMIAMWGLFSRGGTVARTGALLYATVSAVMAFLLSGVGVMLSITGQGQAIASLVLGAQAAWALCAAVTGAAVRADMDGFDGQNWPAATFPR